MARCALAGWSTILGALVLSASPAVAQRVTGFTPASGPPGTLVKVIGSDLDRVTGVLFHGVDSPSFRVVSPVHVKAVVPEGTTTGPIAVLAPGGWRAESRADFVIVAPAAEGPVLSLALPRPSPVTDVAMLDFTLTVRGPVRLAVYDLNARLVRTLADGVLAAGPHARPWDGRDERGRPVASGVYLVALEAEGDRLVRRLAVLR